MKTYSIKKGEIQKDWYVVDADGQILGRFASKVAQILKGKHKPTYTPHMDMGDFVVVVNAEKIRLSGKKAFQKKYFRHSGYPGAAKFTDFQTLRRTHPDRVISAAVKGMLPHNRLGRAMLRHLKVYRGPDHPHAAQGPRELKI
ncbi:MAG: 50S ribosomal protein L13 [Fidelibacterota bacterium]